MNSHHDQPSGFDPDYAHDTEQRAFPMPDGTPQIEILPGIHQRTMTAEDGLVLREFLLERGAIVPEHTHPIDHAGYVIEGKLELWLKGQPVVYGPGQRYVIPKHVPHSARALKDTLLIEVYKSQKQANVG
jgi:quercetin dioxygenase-like cupin family protein